MVPTFVHTGQSKIYRVRGEVRELTPFIGVRPIGELVIGLYRERDEVVCEWTCQAPRLIQAWQAMWLLQRVRIGDELTLTGCWFAIGIDNRAGSGAIPILAEQFKSEEAFAAARAAARLEAPDADQLDRMIGLAADLRVEVVSIVDE